MEREGATQLMKKRRHMCEECGITVNNNNNNKRTPSRQYFAAISDRKEVRMVVVDLASIFFTVIVCIVFLACTITGLLKAWRRNVLKANMARREQWCSYLINARSSDSSCCFDACAEAGIRSADCELSTQPMLKDPVSKVLCGKLGSKHGLKFMQLMIEQEGTGKSSFLASRARILDDDLSFMISSVTKDDPCAEAVQIVHIGCGMDTRPWRLRRGGSNRGAGSVKLIWYDVDKAAVLELKAKMLSEAGIPLDIEDKLQRQHKESQLSQQRLKHSMPALAVDKMIFVACDLDRGSFSLEHALKQAGFSCSLPTIWLFEGLLCSLTLAHAVELLRQCGRLSGPCSQILAAVASKDQMASISKDKGTEGQPCFGHDLIAPGVLEGTGWSGVSLSKNLSELARTRYRVECYPRQGLFEVHESASLPHTLAAMVKEEQFLNARV